MSDELMGNKLNIDLGSERSYQTDTVVRTLSHSDLSGMLKKSTIGMRNRAEVELISRIGSPTVIFGGDADKRTFLLKALANSSDKPSVLIIDSNEDFLDQIPREKEGLPVSQIIFESPYGAVYNRYTELTQQGVWNEEVERLMNFIDEKKIWDFEGDLEKMFSEIGLSVNMMNRSFNTLSDGERKKVLAILMYLNDRTLIALNEPFQYLDVRTREFIWKRILTDKNRGFIITTAEESMLDDIEEGQLVGIDKEGTVFATKSLGVRPYERWIEIKDRTVLGWVNEAESLKTRITQLQVTVRAQRADQKRLRSKAAMQVTTQLESRLEKMEEEYQDLPGYVYVEEGEKFSDLKFVASNPVHGRILKVFGDVVITAGDKEIGIGDLELDINGRSTLLIVGPNGSGKSSMIKALFGLDSNYRIKADQVSVREDVVELGYFNPQNTNQLMKNFGSVTLENYVSRVLGKKFSEGRANRYLSFWGIPYYKNRDAKCGIIQDQIPLFSQKLQLALLMALEPNVLVLDEPSGVGLSESELERLISSIEDYNGALIVISHDKRFFEDPRIQPTHILDMGTKKLKILSVV